MNSGADTVLDPKTSPAFPIAAREMLGDTQLRKNVRHATEVIQAKRARVVGEMPDWQQLRESGRQIRDGNFDAANLVLEPLRSKTVDGTGKRRSAREHAGGAEKVTTRGICKTLTDGMLNRRRGTTGSFIRRRR